MYLRGDPNLEPIMKQRAEMGFTVIRAFRYAAPPNAFAVDPRQHPNYIQAIVELTDLAASRGLYVEWTAGDAQVLGFGLREQQANLDAVTEALMGKPYFLEALNEPFKNGYLGAVPKPLTLRASGDYDDDSLHQHLLDYHCIHGTRDSESRVFPKWIWDQIWCLYDGWPGFPALNMPVVHDELMGCADVSQPGRRSNNSHHFYLLGTTANYDIGLTFHCENGMRSELFSDIQGLCASEFIRGMRTAL
jgi:hypothetical protein